jgi:hypothetical protein
MRTSKKCISPLYKRDLIDIFVSHHYPVHSHAFAFFKFSFLYILFADDVSMI